MIIKNAKTTFVADNPWTSPDGKVTIWTVSIETDEEGYSGQYSTMSKSVAQEGFQGDLELYTNAKGKDYLRQAPKEDKGFSASQGSDKAYLKDLSSMPLDVLKTLMPYIDAQALVSGDKPYYGKVMTLVSELSNELLTMSDNIRGSGEKQPEKPQNSPQTELSDPFEKP